MREVTPTLLQMYSWLAQDLCTHVKLRFILHRYRESKEVDLEVSVSLTETLVINYSFFGTLKQSKRDS